MFSRRLVPVGPLAPLVVGALFALMETTSLAATNDAFIKTNGNDVIIGNRHVRKNSPLDTDEFKEYMRRVEQVDEIGHSSLPNATDKFAEGARALIKDYPRRPDAYYFMLSAILHYEFEGKLDQARTLAKEMIEGPAPEKFKQNAKGFLYRLDSLGKEVTINFISLDGREVDLAKMKGKVVLVDFWGTGCHGCVEELPRVKAAFDKYHGQGFEVIGISDDRHKARLQRFLKQRKIGWPQYFDEKGTGNDKFYQEFGISGIPHMFLVDKKGCLRFDNVRARGDAHFKGDTTSIEEKISALLAEP